ncbi:hypothetical protein JVU11DRAFT_8333 [Chiua virens]|nr:hypothetical protein JVU11DRAFT_8333 [Chiua virens]
MGTMFYATMPDNLIFVGFYFNFAKMYINSYLALLNARQPIRRRNSRPVSLQPSRLPISPYISDFDQDLLSTLRSDKLQVCIETTVDQRSERDNPPIVSALPATPGGN